MFRQQKGEFTAGDARSSFDKRCAGSFVWEQEDRMLFIPLSKEINMIRGTIFLK